MIMTKEIKYMAEALLEAKSIQHWRNSVEQLLSVTTPLLQEPITQRSNRQSVRHAEINAIEGLAPL